VRVAITSLYVRDVDAAFKFYTEVLGFVEKLRLPEAGLAALVSPEQPEGPALLLEPNGNPIASPPLVFAVADLDGEYQRLIKLGVEFRQAPTETDWGTEAMFDDTCGNLIRLQQHRAV
jgi:catechol 2,3-dioxygenase-like lactoylglutathione lyase family enzyme